MDPSVSSRSLNVPDGRQFRRGVDKAFPCPELMFRRAFHATLAAERRCFSMMQENPKLKIEAASQPGKPPAPDDPNPKPDAPQPPHPHEPPNEVPPIKLPPEIAPGTPPETPPVPQMPPIDVPPEVPPQPDGPGAPMIPPPEPQTPMTMTTR
ncbi:MAG TPA: hypothetical protein VGN05_10035 [Parvibaculum sp.]